MNLVSPWINYYREVEALFGKDPEIKIVFDNDTCVLKIYVESPRKAEALQKLLPEKKVYGNIEMKIEIIPANDGVETIYDIVADAFNGNPVLEELIDIDTPFGKRYYAMFKNEVVQYFNDNMQDLNGLRSTLYQDLAKELLNVGDNCMFFCTEPKNAKLEKPLGEWP